MRQIFNWYDELPDIDKVIILVSIIGLTLGMARLEVSLLNKRVSRLERKDNDKS